MSNSEFNQEPIRVPESPKVPQIEAGVRQAALAIGVILSTLGFTALAEKVGLAATLAPQIAILVAVLGPALAGAAAWLGQIATRHQAQKAAIMASKLDDKDAVLVKK